MYTSTELYMEPARLLDGLCDCPNTCKVALNAIDDPPMLMMMMSSVSNLDTSAATTRHFWTLTACVRAGRLLCGRQPSRTECVSIVFDVIKCIFTYRNRPKSGRLALFGYIDAHAVIKRRIMWPKCRIQCNWNILKWALRACWVGVLSICWKLCFECRRDEFVKHHSAMLERYLEFCGLRTSENAVRSLQQIVFSWDWSEYALYVNIFCIV